jgi:hypothetical protein
VGILGRLKFSVGLVCTLLLLSAPAASAVSGTQYQWRIDSIGARYTTYGPWNFCAESRGGTVNCSHAFTVANTVTGQVGVSIDLLSESLGYSVTTSATVTGGASYAVPRHRTGVAQWRAVYLTRAVQQHLYQRRWGCGRASCGHGPWQATNRYETAYASRYLGPGFRVVIS